MTAMDISFHALLQAVLTAEADGKLAGLRAGTPQDYAAYRHQVGYLQCIDDTIERCKEIEKKVRGG